MTRANTHPPSRHLTVALRRIGIVAATLIAILVALYLALPYLVAHFSPLIGQRLGLRTLELTVARPGWHTVTIEQLVATTDAVVIRGEDARIDYTWFGLRQGRASRVTIGTLDVALLSRASADETPAPEIDNWFQRNPTDELIVERLIVTFPDTGFVGHGRADFGAAGLSVALNGIAPEVASRFSVAASLTRDGSFSTTFGSRDSSAGEFLSLGGQIGSDSVAINGAINLSGYPLQLASELAGLPRGTGTVMGKFRTRLPWPLPNDIVLGEIDATVPALAVDWRAADRPLELRGVEGTASLARGEVAATLTGAIGYRLAERDLTLVLPSDYTLYYAQDAVRGPAGLRLQVDGVNTKINATLSAFSLGVGSTNELAVDADVDARLDPLHATGRLGVSVNGDALGLTARMRLAGQPARGHSALDGLLDGSGTVAFELKTQLATPGSATLSWAEVVATVPSFAVDWKSRNNQFEMSRISGAAQIARGTVDATLSGTLRHRQGGRDITATLPANYKLAYAPDKLSGGRGLRLRVTDDATEAQATLRSATVTWSDKRVVNLDADIDSQIASVRIGGRLKGSATLTDVDKRRGNGRFDFGGTVQQADARHEGTLGATFSLRGDKLGANGSLNVGPIGDTSFVLAYDLASRAGRLDASNTFDVRQPLAATFRPGWQAAYDLDGGRIETALTLRWANLERVMGDAQLTLSDGRAHYATWRASGIAGRMQFRSDDIREWSAWRLEPTQIKIGRINTGTPLDDVTVGLAWAGDRVDVFDGRATVLGGTATTGPFAYDIATGNAQLAIALTAIDLGKVLALEGDDIAGQGTLDGDLPVTITQNKARIDSGVMSSRPPGGTIRLTPKLAAAAGQSQFGFALLALQNFSYTVLRATINYAENGDLALGVHLQGRNPAVEKGRPIHYNLNISENVPVLLESLRLQDKLTEGIEYKIKK